MTHPVGATGTRPPSRWPGMKRAAAPWLFLAPALAFYLVVVVYPALASLRLSFYTWDGLSPTMTFVGLANYETLFRYDPVFIRALRDTAVWTLVYVPASIVLGLSLALVLNRPFRGRTLFRIIFYLPFVLSAVAAGLIWELMYYPGIGFLDTTSAHLGFGSYPVGWLSDPHVALYAIIAAAVWQFSGAPMVIFLAGLQTVPAELQEAARVAGANSFQVLRYVTLPLLRESFIVAFSLAIIASLNVFDIVYAMTLGGPADSTQVMATWMFFQTFEFSNFGEGAAIAMLLVFLVAIIAIPYITRSARSTYV